MSKTSLSFETNSLVQIKTTLKRRRHFLNGLKRLKGSGEWNLIREVVLTASRDVGREFQSLTVRGNSDISPYLFARICCRLMRLLCSLTYFIASIRMKMWAILYIRVSLTSVHLWASSHHWRCVSIWVTELCWTQLFFTQQGSTGVEPSLTAKQL